jgi:hypothetical protein
MRWNDNLSEFVEWCKQTRDVEEFRQALESVPMDLWFRVELQLHELRYIPDDVEPSLSLGQKLRAALGGGLGLDRYRAVLAKQRIFLDECARRRDAPC